MALCSCDCGNFCYRNKSKVATGHTKSCGCLVTEKNKKLGDSRRIAADGAAFNLVIGSYKRSARERGLTFNLSAREFRELTESNCKYCGKAPSMVAKGRSQDRQRHFIYNGVDRVDNNLGYTTENSVPCCKRCNRMKRSQDLTSFRSKVNRIVRMDVEDCNRIRLYAWQWTKAEKIKQQDLSSFNEVFSSYKYSAKIRGYRFELLESEFLDLTKADCSYCGAECSNTRDRENTLGSFKYNGVDRMDNTKDYTRDNCTSCCSTCNIMKGDLELQEFLDHVTSIVDMWKRVA